MSAIVLDQPAVAALLGALRVALAVLFVVALPLFLVATNLKTVALDPNTYAAGFAKYRVAETTGLDQEQLERVAQSFIAYFQAPPGRLEVEVVLGGQRRPLLNERELAHMEDVQAIMQLFFRLQTLSGVFLAGFLLLGVFVDRAAFLPELGRLLLLAAGLTIGLALLVGLLALTSFSELFLRFHQVAFRNDLWQLDPTRDYLIMLFPEPFWFDATLRIALLTGLETAAAGLVGFLLTRVNVGA